MKEAGVSIYIDPGADKPILEVATLQCVHCGCHWQASPGSGRIRGFCMNCNGPVCGPRCAECVPIDLQLENMEQGRDPLWKPTKIYVPANYNL